MNDHDIIVDLIENRLSTDEAEAAMSRIRSDPDLLAEYDQQLAARAALSAMPAAAMTSAESETLRSSLIEQLNLGNEPAVVPIAKRRTAWWQPVAGIAAVAAAVTAFVILPGTTSSDDAASDTTIVASASAQAAEESVADDGSADVLGSESEGSDTELLAPAAELSPEEVTVVDLEGADLADLLGATAGESDDAGVKGQLESLGYSGEADVDAIRLEECINEVSSELPRGTTSIVFGVDSSGPTPIAHLGLISDAGIESGLSIDLATCGVVTSNN